MQQQRFANRNAEIVAAIVAGESIAAIALRFSLSAQRVAKIRKAANAAVAVGGVAVPAGRMLIMDALESVTDCKHNVTMLRTLTKNIIANAYRRGRVPHDIVVGDQTFERLGAGASRCVFDLGCDKHVIKIEYSKAEFAFQSKAECNYYDKAPVAIRPWLPTMYARFSDYSAVIVEKCLMTAPDAREQMMRAARAQSIGDLHDANLGYRADGRPVILDFGFAGR